MNKRLSILEKVTSSGTADAFAWYALGMEYRKEGRPDDALRAFESLRAAHPDYLPMYLMAGQLLVELARYKDARDWLGAGITLARATGDVKALGELESELEHASAN